MVNCQLLLRMNSEVSSGPRGGFGNQQVEEVLVQNPVIRFFALYYSFIHNAFLKMLAYRLRYFTGIITYLIFVSVHYFIWQAVYANQPAGAEINGFTLSEMVTYVAVGWVARSLYFSNIDVEIETHVRSGQIGIYLLRPVNYQLMHISQALGESLFRLFFFTIPISIVIFSLFPVQFPSFTNAILFAIATFLGFLIMAQINFLIGMLAFSFKSIDGVMRAKYYLIQLLSGLLLPLTFFPMALQSVLDVLPFKMIAFVPLQMYLGKVSVENALSMFFQESSWFLALVAVGQVFWKRAFAKLTVQGG